VEIAGDALVVAVVGTGHVGQRFFELVWCYVFGEGDGLGAEFRGGVKEDYFVDEVLAEESGVEVRAAFEEKAQDVAIGEGGESGREAEASGVLWEGFDLGSGFGEGVDAGFGGGFAAEDEEIVFCGDNEL
jgi:hypothetical protein